MAQKNTRELESGLTEKLNDKTGIDFCQLDLDRHYTPKEFETINDWLKTNEVGLDDRSKKHFPGSISHFDYISGYLVPMPQTPVQKEVVVLEIGRQLGSWNIYTHQNGAVTSSQGGFDFSITVGEKSLELQMSLLHQKRHIVA